MRHVLRLGLAPDGTVRGKLDMIESGERGVPLTRVHLSGREVRIECKPFQIVHTGRLSEDRNRLEMKLERGATEAAAVFQRASGPWVFEEPRGGTTGPPLARALEGEWTGVADRQSTFWRLGLRFGLDASGRHQVRYIQAVAEPEGVPFLSTNVRFDGPEFAVEWLGAFWGFSKFTLKATLDEKLQRISGTLDADGALAPVILERYKRSAAEKEVKD